MEAPAVISFSGIRHGIAETKGFFEGIGKDHFEPGPYYDSLRGFRRYSGSHWRYQATMKATGKRVDTPVAHYWEFRDGKVARYVGFLNNAALVEALLPGPPAP